MKKFITLILAMLVSTLSMYASPQTKYIEKYDSMCIALSKEYKIPASVIMSVAIHESGYGTSSLSKKKHNHFGIKKGNHYRSYESDSESFRHFCEYISTRKYYKYLVDNNITDYKTWIYKIKSGGYSQSSNWATKVIYMVNRNNLDKLDNKKSQN